MHNGFCHTVKGASHETSGTPCQDYSAYRTYDRYSIAVVADGHGSKKHFRSDVGSRCAVESAIETIEEFYSDPGFEDAMLANHEDIIKRIEKQVIARWNDKIQEHFDLNPVTDKEKSPFTDEQFKELHTETFYGTTLIAAVMNELFTFGIQIGDGSLVTIFDDGETDMPIMYQESAPANITASICNSNAIDLFCSFFIDDKYPMAVYVSTDGLYTSFNSEYDFLDYHTIITSRLADFDSFDPVILKNLTKRAHYGTQDDISISCVYDEDAVEDSIDIIQQAVESNKQRALSRKAEELANIEKQRLKMAMAKSRHIVYQDNEDDDEDED